MSLQVGQQFVHIKSGDPVKVMDQKHVTFKDERHTLYRMSQDNRWLSEAQVRHEYGEVLAEQPAQAAQGG